MNGIEVVWSEEPLVPPGGLALRRQWRIPPDPIDPDDTTWEAPAQIRAGAEYVYVLDRPASRVTVLDWKGNLVRRIGRRGAGPGELLRPGDLLLMGNQVGVTDRGAAVWYDSLGAHRGSGGLPVGSIQSGRGVSLPGMVIGAWPLEGGRAMFESPRGWFIGFPGDSLRLIVPPFPVSQLAPEWSTIAGGSCGRVVPGPSGTILRLRCITLVVQVLDTTGAALREFGVPDRPEIASDQDIARADSSLRARNLRAGMRPELAAMSAEFDAQQIREKPRYRAVRATDSSLIVWEQTPAELGDGPAAIHVFTVTGIYLGRITTDEQWIDLDLRDDTIVALAREPETGLVYATGYRMEVPPAVRAAAAAAFR